MTYGTTLSGTQLNASSNVSGTYAYTPPSGTLLPAGSTTLSVVFTLDDTNVAPMNASVPFTVVKASSTTDASDTTVTCGASSVRFSATVTSTTATVSEGTVTFTVKDGGGTIKGTLTTPTVDTGSTRSGAFQLAGLTAGTYSIIAVYNPASSGPNFLGSTASTRTFTIKKAAPVFSIVLILG